MTPAQRKLDGGTTSDDLYFIYVNGRNTAFPMDMSHTCHDCGYKRFFKATRQDVDIYTCKPTRLSFSDCPPCVERNCVHWVPKGKEDLDIEYGAFVSRYDEEEDGEWDECENAISTQSGQRSIFDYAEAV